MFDPSAISKLVVQAPHPVSDQQTEFQATDIMTKEQARILMIAGAHRNTNAQLVDGDRAADVANFAGSIFQAIHEVIISDTSLVILQPHGFADATEPNYNVILSQGETTSSQQVKDMADGLLHLGFIVQVYDGTGVLGATGNAQGKATRAVVQYVAGFNPWFARTESISSNIPL